MYQTTGRDHASTFRHHGAREREAAARTDERPAYTIEQLTEDAILTASSLRTSRLRIDGALAQPCIEHAARAGCYCWETPGTAVRGLCLARYTLGAGNPARYARGTDGLAEIAAAARQVMRTERARLAVRHPNRHQLAHQRQEGAL